MKTFTLDIVNTLDFFDNQGKEVLQDLNSEKKDANALNVLFGEDLALAIFGHFLSSAGPNHRSYIIRQTPTSGRKNGTRLDYWVLIEHELYQCEIKSWNSNSLSSYRLPALQDDKPLLAKDIDPTALRLWNAHFHDYRITHNQVAKILDEMSTKTIKDQATSIFESWGLDINDATLREPKPLLIFWFPLIDPSKEPEPEIEPFMKVGLTAGSKHGTVEVFSCSLYLRKLLLAGIRKFEFQSEALERRLNLVRALVE